MERLERDIPDPKHISIQQVTKNNGIVLDGLSIMEMTVIYHQHCIWTTITIPINTV